MGTTITDQFTLITKNMITRKIQSQPGSVHGHLHGDPSCLCVVSSSVVSRWKRLQVKEAVKKLNNNLHRQRFPVINRRPHSLEKCPSSLGSIAYRCLCSVQL